FPDAGRVVDLALHDIAGHPTLVHPDSRDVLLVNHTVVGIAQPAEPLAVAVSVGVEECGAARRVDLRHDEAALSVGLDLAQVLEAARVVRTVATATFFAVGLEELAIGREALD